MSSQLHYALPFEERNGALEVSRITFLRSRKAFTLRILSTDKEFKIIVYGSCCLLFQGQAVDILQLALEPPSPE
ncbi:unnamed protein product [Acanthoscelides obtectus]|uniref:Uncharacterized protein n=1 Tax=Acanthoscelides obtectus TaxID=200917 RepID=A0A9P0M948_ACAOB|nr:unnamed protein product [Acanthoscelides obtectus]CAK1679486.1 hypothetical protein AOBTE_LOCUS32284 [Acanthoscelides obtectus]